MSQANMITLGEILQRKQKQLQAVTDAKAALRSLMNDTASTMAKGIADMDADLLQSHLQRFVEKQNEWRQMEKEIKELSY
jgi:hypothetical protein